MSIPKTIPWWVQSSHSIIEYEGASNFSPPFKKVTPMTNIYSRVFPPSFLISSPAAFAEPPVWREHDTGVAQCCSPVAITSSMTITFVPGEIESDCISNMSWSSFIRAMRKDVMDQYSLHHIPFDILPELYDLEVFPAYERGQMQLRGVEQR